MKRPILVSWILLLFHLTCFSLVGQSQDAQDMQKSCGTFVQSFYDRYVKQPDSSRALKYRPSAFSPELSRALKEDDEAQAKEPGYIVGLDWDPTHRAAVRKLHPLVHASQLGGSGASERPL
jgi:hypothetical protein